MTVDVHPELPGWLAPARTALLAIDAQRDFAAPDGALGRHGADLGAVAPALRRLGRLAEAARRAGATVVFAQAVTRPETDPPALATWMARRGTPDHLAFCRAGTAGAEPFGIGPEPGDISVSKLLYSAFAGTDLAATLRERQVDTLLLAGLTTECCVLATAFDGFHLGFNIMIAEDACAAYGEALHQGAIDILKLNCALLTTTDAAVAAWAGVAR